MNNFTNVREMRFLELQRVPYIISIIPFTCQTVHLYLLVLTEVLNESEELKSSHKDIEALSKSIVTFLGEVHQPSAEAIQAKLDNLVQQQSNFSSFIRYRFG
uniref:Uncharacterized protein n=1 Tax=Glossina pallidipes TaxID=7398 RepID=A0A1A9ZET5_GLOPL